ncbi:DUF3822 family protein [uncultured Polaribacter sp.]|uniref:DUF3822 family protein n=1 Tax=uncultured Polaribacter sp. TaxID=174711 RepID=UPI0026035E09|nr:DUF3822 family protein [uncultured Polaribacter sp.]
MIKKKVQKKNSKTSLEKTKDIELSIQFSLGGFSFCVTNSITKEDLFFSEYCFNKPLKTPNDLLTQIETIFKEDTNLQLQYSKILVIHQNNLSALVPEKYFKEEAIKSYLNFNLKTLKSDFFTYDDLPTLHIKNIYIPYVNINNYLFQNFGEFDYKHYSTILLEKLCKIEHTDENTMYVNLANNSFHIVVFNHKKLIFSNSFDFETKEDFLYYLLFTAEQLALNTEKIHLYLLGDIKKDSKLYNEIYTYIKNVYFLESKNPIFNDLDISKHSNYILLGL